MGAETKIQWTDHTFNPWIGCTEVSPGCDNCYARELAARFGMATWGAGEERHRTSPANWREPLKWNRQAEREGRRGVFCASMADVFDAEVPQEWRDDLFALIRSTPWLDWQLLTKRPNLFARYLPADWGAGYPNVWLGTSVESQDYAWRIQHLLGAPAVLHFLSCEPLLGPLLLGGKGWLSANAWGAPLVDWVIVGGESGPQARPCELKWVRRVIADCHLHRVPVFVKQLGRNPVGPKLNDPHGGNMDEWPEDLRVREMP